MLKADPIPHTCRKQRIYCMWSDNKVRETHRGKSAALLIAEYHCGHLQRTPLGKLCTDASA
jgi:hypothetical protein